MYQHPLKIFMLFAVALLIGACNNTKYIANGDSLYLGTTVTIKDKNVSQKERKVIVGDLEQSVRPLPNKKILGIRFKLTVYNLAGEPKKPKGLRNWLRTKVGEAPSLTSQFDMAKNKLVLQNILENRGFFYPEIIGKIE